MAKHSVFMLLFNMFFLLNITKAQQKDSLVVKLGTIATYASKDYQPLWLTANKFGTIADRKSDLSTFLSLANTHHFSGSKRKTDSIGVAPWYVKYGAAVYSNDHFGSFFAEQLYAKAGYKKLEFRAGRFEETSGDIDPTLSSGSLGISGNSLPIPKIGFAFTDYVPVPFTKGFISFKGQISHGWFGNNRYMKDAFYHEKMFYVQLGKKKFKLYAGVQHFVEWGGRRGSIQLERSLKGFVDVLLVREADDGSVGTAINGLPPNRPGDQRGLLEAGFKYENESVVFNGYNQTPFETGRDVDVRNVDRLLGLQLMLKKPGSVIKKITAELLNTKDMLSFVEIADRQSFYNNGFYKTGWEYQNRIVGTPLFTNRNRASKYFSSYTPYDWNTADNTIPGNSNIVNNRVVAFHFGLLYAPVKNFLAKTLVTYSKNYGTTSGNAPFEAGKSQVYTLQQMQYQLPKVGLGFGLGIAFDTGDLSDNTGFSLSVTKQFNRVHSFTK